MSVCLKTPTADGEIDGHGDALGMIKGCVCSGFISSLACFFFVYQQDMNERKGTSAKAPETGLHLGVNANAEG